MTRKRKISRNFYKRGVIWWIRYLVKGQQVRESSESENREDADRLLKKRLAIPPADSQYCPAEKRLEKTRRRSH